MRPLGVRARQRAGCPAVERLAEGEHGEGGTAWRLVDQARVEVGLCWSFAVSFFPLEQELINSCRFEVKDCAVKS